jgi:hypothetical protein
LASRRYSIVIADRKTGVLRRATIPLGPTLAITVTALTLPILIGLGARWSAIAKRPASSRRKSPYCRQPLTRSG